MKIKEQIPHYLEHLQTLGRAPATLRACRYNLLDFARFLEAEKVLNVEDLTPEIVEEYQQDLAFRIIGRGSLLGVSAQVKMIGNVTGFTRFLKDRDYLVSDPGERIRRPKLPQRLPRTILSIPEVQKIMQTPDMQTRIGYRNRVMLEILYDTGMRRSELSNLKISDLDLPSGYVLIRSGKGDKDRVVPMSPRVCELVRNYILLVRPSILQNAEEEGTLFLNYEGHGMDASCVAKVVKRYAAQSGIKKNITTHTFRHTCATHMLRNGAPIRHLQELLGHVSIETTQIYTHVTINDLKEVHTKYHPSEKNVKSDA